MADLDEKRTQPPYGGPRLPHTYDPRSVYDLETALKQGTLFPELDDHWREVAREEEASGYAWHRGLDGEGDPDAGS